MEKNKISIYDQFKNYNAIKEGDAKTKPGQGNLTYLSWASAWEQVLKVDAEADWEVVTDASGNLYHNDGKTCDVRVKLTIGGLTRTMTLPVMDHRNNSITLENITSRNVNDSIQRCLVKCCAKFGLGLSLYQGEGLTEAEKDAMEADCLTALEGCSSYEEVCKVYNYYMQADNKLFAKPALSKALQAAMIKYPQKAKK